MAISPRAVKAYRNVDFLTSPEARGIRILSEYSEPRARLDRMGVRDTIVFFGSARFKDREAAEKMLATASTQKEKQLAQVALGGSRYYEEARQLAGRLARWSQQIADNHGPRFVICTGGGPGIMEAANRGAHEAGSPSIGFNISLPFEQAPNPYITPELCFDFHYFFMRKLWFAYLGKALIIFPGGFGTLDEMMEVLTLVQTHKLRKQMLVLIYGREYWDKVLNLEALADFGTIDREDLELYRYADTVDDAFSTLTEWLNEHYVPERPPASIEEERVETAT